MKKKIATIALLLGICFLAVTLPERTSADGSNPPKTMTKIIIVNTSPEVVKDSFEAKPRTMYFATLTYGRIEEPYDSKMKLQQLMVISEPDCWIINLADKSGKHMVDPGPTFELHSPAFAIEKLPKIFYSFEFGHEFEFFEKASHKKKYPKVINGHKFDSYAVGTGGYMVVVYTEPGQEIPLFAFFFKKNHIVASFQYLDYEKGLPFDPSLFKPPSGIQISEQKMDDGK